MLDVSPEDVASMDKSRMLLASLSTAEQIESSLARSPPPALPRPSKVLVTGMGGSAIGGSYLAAWAERESRIPVVVNRSYAIPSWVDGDTLVLAVSYSGETEETLSALAQARDKGARIAAVSTGGRIERYATRAGGAFVRVESGLQPRAAFGRMLAAGALVLESAGVLRAREGLESAVKALRAMTPDLGADVPPPRNEAKRTALALHGSIPAIYAADALAPVATRMANQLHENSKTLAWAATMPEMNHNELVAWSATEETGGLAAVFLRDRQESRALAERWDFTSETVRGRGVPLVQLEARGDHVLARQLSLTLVGDAASVYLAVLRKVDPTPVDVIGTLKTRVASAGVVAELDRKVR